MVYDNELYITRTRTWLNWMSAGNGGAPSYCFNCNCSQLSVTIFNELHATGAAISRWMSESTSRSRGQRIAVTSDLINFIIQERKVGERSNSVCCSLLQFARITNIVISKSKGKESKTDSKPQRNNARRRPWNAPQLKNRLRTISENLIKVSHHKTCRMLTYLCLSNLISNALQTSWQFSQLKVRG